MTLHTKMVDFIIITHMIGVEVEENFGFYKLQKLDILRYIHVVCDYAKLHCDIIGRHPGKNAHDLS